MKLTRQAVETALYEGESYVGKSGRKRWRRCVLWDDDLPGFGLRITSTHRKSFIVSYRADGRQRTRALGNADELDLEEARRRAEEILTTIEEPQSADDSPAGIETVAELAEVYLDQHLRGQVPSWYGDQRLIRTYIQPAIGRTPIAEVSRTNLASLCNRMGGKFPADAGRLRSLLIGMFDWAAERNLWSRRPGGRGQPAARPLTAAETEAEDGRQTSTEASLPPAEELAKSLLRAQERCKELEAQLEEVSVGGVEMLAALNEQTARRKELEEKLSRARQRLLRARSEAKSGPDPEETARQLANLQKSVEQLMESLTAAERDRDRAAGELAAVEARARAQTKNLAALIRSRNELEKQLSESERRAAFRQPPRDSTRPWRWFAAGLGGGAIVAALGAWLLMGPLGRQEAGGGPPPAGKGGASQPPSVIAATGAGDAAAGAAVRPPAEALPGTSSGGGAPAPAGPTPDPESEPETDPETEPGRAPGPAASPQASTAAAPEAAEAAARSWAAAWSEQRVDDYLAAYSSSFEPPDGMGREEWAARRRDRILRPDSIRVTLGAIRRTAVRADRFHLTFEQSYETPTYADRVIKTLELMREEGGWKILAERVDGPASPALCD